MVGHISKFLHGALGKGFTMSGNLISIVGWYFLPNVGYTQACVHIKTNKNSLSQDGCIPFITVLRFVLASQSLDLEVSSTSSTGRTYMYLSLCYTCYIQYMKQTGISARRAISIRTLEYLITWMRRRYSPGSVNCTCDKVILV